MTERKELNLPGLPPGAFIATVAAELLPGPGEYTLLTVTVFGVPIAYSATYVVARDGTALQLERDDVLGKASDGASVGFGDGVVRQFTVEADPIDRAPGSSSGVSYYDTQPFANLAYRYVATQADILALQKQIAALDARLDKIAAGAAG